MKFTKFILSFLCSLLVSAFAAPAFGAVLSVSPVAVGAVLTVAQFIPMGISGVAMAGVYREVWTKALKEELSSADKAGFLEGIEDVSQHVKDVGNESQVIHMTYMGVEPDVLINNTTYPIPEQALGEEDIPITLDKYQTKVTPVTDDELYALAYDKIGTTKRKHGKAITKAKYKKAIHAIAPGDGTNADMPVLVTTGADDGTGRKKMVKADLLNLKRALDKLDVPLEGRRLVLCADHVNDLLEIDNTFKDQYSNEKTGKLHNMYGFDLYQYIAMPYYTPATKVKLAFGAVPAGTDQQASIFFSMERVVKASGWVKMYYQEAKNDPATQTSRVNFRHHYIVMPTREEARGAIISANVA